LQAAVDIEHHLIVAHDVTNVVTDVAQLAPVALLTKAALGTERLEVVAGGGYFSSEQILVCEEAGVTVTLLKPQTSGNRVKGRFVKPDFRVPCRRKAHRPRRNEEDERMLRRYWTSACPTCVISDRCTSGKERRVTRWQRCTAAGRYRAGIGIGQRHLLVRCGEHLRLKVGKGARISSLSFAIFSLNPAISVASAAEGSWRSAVSICCR
jgi:hypothetical protein